VSILLLLKPYYVDIVSFFLLSMSVALEKKLMHALQEGAHLGAHLLANKLSLYTVGSVTSLASQLAFTIGAR
jgi:hypothetical protein